MKDTWISRNMCWLKYFLGMGAFVLFAQVALILQNVLLGILVFVVLAAGAFCLTGFVLAYLFFLLQEKLKKQHIEIVSSFRMLSTVFMLTFFVSGLMFANGPEVTWYSVVFGLLSVLLTLISAMFLFGVLEDEEFNK